MSRARLRAAVLAVALVASVGLTVGASQTTASAAQKTKITAIAKSKPIKGEKFSISGTISTRVARPVQLQRRTKHSWKTVRSASTGDSGKFTFSTSTLNKKKYRVRAPKVRVDAKTYRMRVTPSRTVKPVSQTVRASVSRATARAGQTVRLTIAATPARKGRMLGLKQTFKGQTYAGEIGAENSRGTRSATQVISASLPKGKYTYQPFVYAENGAAKKYGKAITLTIVN